MKGLHRIFRGVVAGLGKRSQPLPFEAFGKRPVSVGGKKPLHLRPALVVQGLSPELEPEVGREHAVRNLVDGLAQGLFVALPGLPPCLDEDRALVRSRVCRQRPGRLRCERGQGQREE